MIKNKSSYQKTLKDIQLQENHIRNEEIRFRQMGLTLEQVEQAVQPLKSFLENLKEDALEYEKINDGNFDSMTDFRSIGKILIAGRIYKGVTQGELAKRLGVAESQISRDEKNEYYGSSIEKLSTVLSVLEIDLKIAIEMKE